MPSDLQALYETYPGAQETGFGDSAELSDHLCSLVRSGKKTATVSALHHYAEEGQALPQIGQFQIVLDPDGRPEMVLRITDVTICAFDEVDWAFARDEGENDTLEGWRNDHRDFFGRNGGFSPQMPLVCERFELVEDLKSHTGTREPKGGET